MEVRIKAEEEASKKKECQEEEERRLEEQQIILEWNAPQEAADTEARRERDLDEEKACFCP